MPTLKSLHERTFAGKPLKSFRVYNDPFGGNEVCIELTFVDGHVECLSIGPGRPEIVSNALCYEDGRQIPRADALQLGNAFPQAETPPPNDVGVRSAGH